MPATVVDQVVEVKMLQFRNTVIGGKPLSYTKENDGTHSVKFDGREVYRGPVFEDAKKYWDERSPLSPLESNQSSD